MQIIDLIVAPYSMIGNQLTRMNAFEQPCNKRFKAKKGFAGTALFTRTVPWIPFCVRMSLIEHPHKT